MHRAPIEPARSARSNVRPRVGWSRWCSPLAGRRSSEKSNLPKPPPKMPCCFRVSHMGPFPQPNLTLPVPLRRVRGRACDMWRSADSKCPRSTAFGARPCPQSHVDLCANQRRSMRADGPDRPSSSYGCITRDLEMNSRMLGGPGVSVRGLCPLPGVGTLIHVRAAPGS